MRVELKYKIFFIIKLLFVIISGCLFLSSAIEEIEDKNFCKDFEDYAESQLTSYETDILKEKFKKKLNWHIPSDTDIDILVILVYIILFGICGVPVTKLLFLNYINLKKISIICHQIILIFIILLIIFPNIFTIKYTIKIIKPMNITDYYTTDKEFIDLMKKKISELNKRTVKMIFASLMVLTNIILSIAEMIILIFDKELLQQLNNNDIKI